MNEKWGVKTSLSNVDLLKELKIIVLSVKPQVMDKVLTQIAPHLTEDHLLVSVAAGYSIEKIESFVGKDKRVVRVMPNTPAKIGAGAAGYSMGTSACEEDSKSVKLLMDSVGLAFEVPETSLDAVTGVSGSGPAYIFMLIEAMGDGGVKNGLPRDVSYKLAAQTVFGAAKMVLETGMHPGQLKDAVTSPGGTTIEAVNRLEELGFRHTAMQAVTAACEKSIKMSKTK